MIVLNLPDQPYITPNSRAHWSKRAACASAWRTTVANLTPKPQLDVHPPVTVTLTLHAKDRRRRDPDSISLVGKWCIDGLVDAGVISDDDAKHVAQVSYRIVLPDTPQPAHRWVLQIGETA
jgi:crossover junction endodeoxyribonuclease RusA